LRQRGIETVEVAYGAPRVGDVLRNYSIVAKAKDRLGWEPKTTLPAGIEATVDWFLERARQQQPAGSHA
jgi:nucleoside-diphosphate-sugar epimerase